MNRILASFAACMLLLHAAIGCCWHHQHVAVPAEANKSQFLPVVCGGHAHSHDGHRHDHDHDSAPTESEHRHSDDGCGEGACQFVKAEATASLSLLNGAMLATAPAIDASLATEGRFANRDRRSSHILEGVPLYLCHQVLVI
ncbi:hypothetical protein [Lacipirellula parvula]|uniref:Cobalt-zinc-cadmium resistance protein CzcD n=1 Tax=Lacipirellula parvula TaxID=2650471 RepID=A0A5K7XGZ5_9BACT|nr:hypothetical protein [Lacipirellula parvula]BBO35312.1 hypothetical protein PLANPX_4924 [Lacipirellula parvula]